MRSAPLFCSIHANSRKLSLVVSVLISSRGPLQPDRHAIAPLLFRITILLLAAFPLCLPQARSQSHSATSATPSNDFAALSFQADAARDADRLEEATSLYKKALALRPTWTEGWWSLGTILYDGDQYPEAARAFRKLLAHDPKNGTAHLMLGLCDYQLNLDASAMADIQAAKQLGIKKDDQLKHVLQYHEGMLLLRKGRFDDAIEILEALAKDGVHSGELDAALGMGVLLVLPNNVPQDGTAERQILLRAGQAEYANLIKKTDDAKKRYTELVQEFPKFPNIHYAYGRFLLASDESKDAVAQFQEEIKNDPRHIRARMRIAASHYRVDAAAGIPYALEVVKLEPKYPFGHYLLGLLYMDSGDVPRSIPELETAARMIPKEPQFQFALGNAYARAGRKQDAARARATFRRLGGDRQSTGGSTTYGEQQPMNLDHNPQPDPAPQERKQP
jgi:predicted Zn-dependent protease